MWMCSRTLLIGHRSLISLISIFCLLFFLARRSFVFVSCHLLTMWNRYESNDGLNVNYCFLSFFNGICQNVTTMCCIPFPSIHLQTLSHNLKMHFLLEFSRVYLDMCQYEVKKRERDTHEKCVNISMLICWRKCLLVAYTPLINNFLWCVSSEKIRRRYE